MIRWLKRTARGALNKLLLRPTIHKTGVDVKALGSKVDMLLGIGKANEAGFREILKSLDMLSREAGEQHEALADRFLESTMETRKALDLLGREMAEQHEGLADRFLESTVETRRALDALADAVNRQQQASGGRTADNAGRISLALDALTGTVNRQQAGLTERIAESEGKTRQTIEALADALGTQREAIGSRFTESAGETRRALDTLADTIARQHATLAGHFMGSAGETRQALEALTDAAGVQREAMASRFTESAGETRQALEALADAVSAQREAMAGSFTESAGETRQALEALADTLARQHATLAGRFTESAGETRQALETAITRSGDSVQAHMTTFVRKIEALERLSFRQHEALAALTRILKTQHPLPPTRGWAASPDLLLHLYELVLDEKPAVVVELGGGVSTLVIAAALKANGRGRLFSFDHDADYAAKTLALLEREGFADVVAVEHAPLSRWLPPAPSGLGESWEWYTLPESLSAIGPIDILVVDGPPEKTGPYARYPALPALAGKLAPGATVLLDDTVREAETTIAQAWRDEFGFALALRSDFEKGLAILTRKPEAARKKKKR